MKITFQALLACLLIAMGVAQPVQAAWPERSIRLIVPSAAGGAGDIPARLFAQWLGDRLGQSVVVENKPGAGGIVGLRALASAQPDGYTLTLTAAASIVISPWLQADPGQHPARMLTPIGLFSYTPLAVAVKADSPFRSLAELVDASRQANTSLVIANPGVNTLAHLGSQLLNARAHARLMPVSFSGFSGGLQALHTGDAAAIIDGVSPILAQARHGDFRILAVGSGEPLAGLESYPLLQDTVSNTQIVGWFGLFGPKGLPASITERLSQALSDIRKDAKLADQMQELGMYMRGQDTPESFAEYVRKESALWGGIIKDGEVNGNAASR